MAGFFLKALDRRALTVILVLLAVAAIVPVLHLVMPATSPVHMPTYLVALFG
jgi:urea transport system permease protein